MAHIELDLRERRLIEDMLIAKASVAHIAGRLSRHRSTIYREIGRNRFDDDELPELGGYYGVLAQRKAAERRSRSTAPSTIAPARSPRERSLGTGSVT